MSRPGSTAQATFAAVVLVAVASYPCVVQTVGGVAPRGDAGLGRPSPAADFCAAVCGGFHDCFAADAGGGATTESASVSDCTLQCTGEVAICPADVLAKAQRCLVAALRECDRAKIRACLKSLKLDCVMPAIADAGR